MIEYTIGNLFESDAEALVNTVNTVGVMGKGVALQFKKNYHNNYKAYVEACKNGEVQIGRMFVVRDHSLLGEKLIVNFPTKTDWRKPSEYEYVERGLDALVDTISQYGIKSIAIPPLGAGNGGLMAGAYASKLGLKTLVLEKHNLPGGAASSFRRGRFEFETSLHEMCQLGTEENPAETWHIFKDINSRVNWKHEDKVYRVICNTEEESYDITLPSGIDEYCKAIDSQIPGSYESLKRYFSYAETAVNTVNRLTSKKLTFKDISSIIDLFKLVSNPSDKFMANLGIPQNTIAVLDCFNDKLSIVVNMLMSVHAADTNDEINAIVEQVQPMIDEFYNEVYFNQKLFEKIKFTPETYKPYFLHDDVHLNEKGYAPASMTDASQCIGCAFCARTCPDCAITIEKID